LNNKTVLMVEDDPHIMNINRISLKKHGFQLLEAETLAEARVFLKEYTPDIILLDVLLPDGTGIVIGNSSVLPDGACTVAGNVNFLPGSCLTGWKRQLRCSQRVSGIFCLVLFLHTQKVISVSTNTVSIT